MKLYCFPRSGNSREVKLVLHEKGISYQAVDIHADKAVTESAEFKKASPKGTVPAIVDGDVYLSDAYRINEYLEDKYPQKQLLPKDRLERQKIRDWVAVIDKKLILKIGLFLLETHIWPEDKRNPENAKKLRAEILEGLKELDSFLKGKDYLFGDYSLADVSITPHISVLPRFGVELHGFPNIERWLAKVTARPNFSASAS